MKVLLDTFPFVWLTSEPSKLSSLANEVLSNQENDFYLSDASVLELSLKYNDGSLEMPSTPRRWVKEQVKIWNIKSIGMTREYCYRLAELPYHHDDAIDRILAATALAEDMYLLTNEEELKKYPVSILW
jgi:PIN domain nuclease of toxin-antitoxin system